jgi:hypothetical protein
MIGSAAGFRGGADQRLDVLRKAGPAVARPGIEELVPDSGIGADALAHFFDVRADALGEIGELVHEGNARRKHGVGRVLGELRRAHIHHEQALAGALERGVERSHDPDRLGIVGAHDHAVRAHEILDGRPSLRNSGFETGEESRPRAFGACRATLSAVPPAVGFPTTVFGHVRPMLQAARRVLQVSRASSPGRAHRDALHRQADRPLHIGRECSRPAAHCA